MGRRKIEIQPLIDERNRSVKAGLFKKAHELSVLCQVDIAVIILGNNQKLYEFSSCDTDDLLKRYKTTNPHESKGPRDYGTKPRRAANKNNTAPAAHFSSDDEDDDDDDDDSVGTPPDSPHFASRQVSNSSRTRAAAQSTAKNKKGNNAKPKLPESKAVDQNYMAQDQLNGTENQRQHQFQHQHQQQQAQSQNQQQNQSMHIMNNYRGGTLYGPRLHQPQQADYSGYYGKGTGYAQNSSSGTQIMSRGNGNSDMPKGDEVDMYVLPTSARSVSTESSGNSPNLMLQRYAGTSSSGPARPQLKVQIPVGGDEQSPLRGGSSGSSNEETGDGNGDGNGEATSRTGPSRSGSIGVSNIKTESDKGSLHMDSDRNRTERGHEVSGNTNSTGHSGSSGSSGGPWANGSSVLLPPPSPSSYMNSGATGPGNPFGRPPLVNSNGEQTPISAALPSKYVNDLLPSPSNFYGSEWNLHFSPATAGFGTGPNSAVPASGGPAVGVGISLSGLANNQATPTRPLNTAGAPRGGGTGAVTRGSPVQDEDNAKLDVRKRTKGGSLKSVSKRVKSTEKS